MSNSLWPLWTVAGQAYLSLTISWSLPKFMFTALVMLSSHLTLWCPLLFLPSIFPSIRDFSNESSILIRWPKHWSFSFSISSFSEYSGLVSLNINWFDLLAVQVTFRGFSSTTVWKHQFFSAHSSFWSNSHISTRFAHDCWKNLLMQEMQGMQVRFLGW